MVVALAAAAYDNSLEHDSSGPRSHGSSKLAMKLPTVSSHVASAGRIARYFEQLEADFGESDTGLSNLILEIAVASIAAAAAAAVAVAVVVSDPAAGRRRTAAVETSVGTVVFVGTVAFAATESGSSAAVVTGRIVGCSCKPVATGSVGSAGVAGFADFADFAVQVGSRWKARPRVAAAGSTSAGARRPNIAHSRLAGRPRMEAAFFDSFIQCLLSLLSCRIYCLLPPTVASLTLTRR
jgi:hypothetical protein